MFGTRGTTIPKCMRFWPNSICRTVIRRRSGNRPKIPDTIDAKEIAPPARYAQRDDLRSSRPMRKDFDDARSSACRAVISKSAYTLPT